MKPITYEYQADEDIGTFGKHSIELALNMRAKNGWEYIECITFGTGIFYLFRRERDWSR